MELLENKSSHSSEDITMEINHPFPLKPECSKMGEKVQICSNFYKINSYSGGRNVLFEYQVSTVPRLTCHTNEEKSRMAKIVRNVMRNLKGNDEMGLFPENYIYREGFIYSFEKVDKINEYIGEEIEQEGISYKISIKLHDDLQFDNPKVVRFFRAFFSLLFKKCKLRPFKAGKHFDPQNPLILKGVNMYRAYFNTVKTLNHNLYLNLNPCVKFFQQDTLLEEIKNCRSEKQVRGKLIGRSVMTIYNQKVYRVDDINFDLHPNDTFCLNLSDQDLEVSFSEYTFTNYKHEVTDPDQPMIKYHDSRTDKDIYLIPEFCVLTGITEEQKAMNFRAIKQDLFANAETKSEQAKAFFQTLKSDKEAYQFLAEKWKIDLEETPMETDAFQCSSGTILGGKDVQCDLSKVGKDFSRQFDAPFKARKINSWAVIHGKFSRREKESLIKQLQLTVKSDFEYICTKPLEVQLKGDDRKPKSWIEALNCLYTEKYLDVIICIVPGKKGSSPVYESLKYYLQTECNIPSQVILSETIKKNKRSLRNIMKNIMVQISAKIGDSPWAFETLPLMEPPTMVIGMDVCHKVGQNNRSVLSFVSSIDRIVGSYYNDLVSLGEKQEIAFSIEKLFKDTIKEFHSLNDSYPERIIIYRDAVSEGQSERTLKIEIPQFEKVIQALVEEEKVEKEPQILFMLVNKRVEQRFSCKNGEAIKNPTKGLVVEREITRPDRFEFYMISHAGPIGLQCPVRYEVIKNTIPDLNPKDLYDLTNILCSGYFNFQGSVRLPAPLMYANTMCNYISKICHNKKFIAGTPQRFRNQLYYI
ncbi:unnamed protein product [Moneuplotes crassus]|uniref:Uncharacterized protein n=1 Tax=Euplotes crassus TaxID=5936 RepID=A0AAD1Y5T3_EUPCR|nr:unnamed protein product [Moneuplotes crassus]